MSIDKPIPETSVRRRKLGELIAERIVAEIIQRGWHAGDMLGTEADFIERYRVSRATFREAVRQLEWHGAAGMKRGTNGGLVVNAPPRLAAIFAIKTYFELTRVDPAESAVASDILRGARKNERAGEDNRAISLFLESADERTIATLFEQREKTGIAPKLSERVALRIVQDIQAAGAVPGLIIGNEASLQQRFGVSRAILREALRPLELHDIIRIKTGVQGGVVVHRADPAYTINITGTYLAYTRIPLSQIWEAHSSMAAASVDGLIRQNALPLPELRRALSRLEAATASHYIVAAGAFHRIIADCCGNRPFALFVRILLHYLPMVHPLPDARFLPTLKEGHRRLVDALEVRDASIARAEIETMFDHSRRWIRKLEADTSAGATS